jgi:hypothetical protein
MESLRGRIRHLTLENPLLRYRWLKASAYTWPNLLLLLGAITGMICSLLLFLVWLDSKRFVDAMPAGLGEREIDGYLERAGVAEGALLIFFFRGLLLIHLVTIFYILAEAFSAGRMLRRWQNEQFGVLPISDRQVVAAVFDWPIIKCLLAVLLTFSLTPLPDRGPGYAAWMNDMEIPFLVAAYFIYSLTPDENYIHLFVWPFYAAHIFALHRTVLIFSVSRWRAFDKSVIAGWVVAAFIHWMRLVIILEQDTAHPPPAYLNGALLLFASIVLLRCCRLRPGFFQAFGRMQEEEEKPPVRAQREELELDNATPY